jgi:hypothetical protein
MRSVRKGENTAGISGTDTSAIGGEGRRGGDGYGQLANPMYTRIDGEVLSKPMNGMATGGKLGYVSGMGRTFSGAGKRKQD